MTNPMRLDEHDRMHSKAEGSPLLSKPDTWL